MRSENRQIRVEERGKMREIERYIFLIRYYHRQLSYFGQNLSEISDLKVLNSLK